jgi:hypothetical protein
MIQKPARKLIPFVLLAAVIVLLTGCGSVAPGPGPVTMLPAFLHSASDITREAYAFAIEHHKDLEQYPCYCGCDKLGHLNNRDCYIQEISKSGEIIYDEHALGCGICALITLDVKKLMAAGRTPRQIRAFIDEKYSVYGPGTNTPPVN